MYPPYYAYRYWACRGPSRLLWFIMGAGTATLYLKHQQAHALHGKHYWSHCQRPQVKESVDESRLATWRRQMEGVSSRRYVDDEWEAEKERLSAISRQAQEAVSDLSESTLNSLLNTIGALKQKLVQNREQRERERQSEGRTNFDKSANHS